MIKKKKIMAKVYKKLIDWSKKCNSKHNDDDNFKKNIIVKHKYFKNWKNVRSYKTKGNVIHKQINTYEKPQFTCFYGINISTLRV